MESLQNSSSAIKDNNAALRQSKIKQHGEQMSVLGMNKSQNSDPFFKDAKVVTCSRVLVKNGQAVAIAFQGTKHPIKEGSPNRSLERASLSQ